VRGEEGIECGSTRMFMPMPMSMSMSMFMSCRNAINVIGNGVVVHVPSLFEEIAELEQKGVDVSLLYVVMKTVIPVTVITRVPKTPAVMPCSRKHGWNAMQQPRTAAVLQAENLFEPNAAVALPDQHSAHRIAGSRVCCRHSRVKFAVSATAESISLRSIASLLICRPAAGVTVMFL